MKFSKLTKISSFLLVGAVAAKSFLTGKKAGSGRVESARRAVDAANARFREAVRLGKAAEIAALYAEDASLLPPNQAAVKGRENIQAYWRACLEMGVKDVVLTTVDLDVLGDKVREIGIYVLKIWPEGKTAREDNGKYLVIWGKAADGSAKLEADIWNTSVPAGQ
jgi:uncharacterized protein (TIGR02246 family)